MKTVFYLRKFLNKKGFHSNAFIFAEIRRTTKEGRKTNSIWHDIDLKISDCDKIVNLSIDLHNIRNANNSIHKLNILINSLKSFKSSLTKEIELLKKNR